MRQLDHLIRHSCTCLVAMAAGLAWHYGSAPRPQWPLCAGTTGRIGSCILSLRWPDYLAMFGAALIVDPQWICGDGPKRARLTTSTARAVDVGLMVIGMCASDLWLPDPSWVRLPALFQSAWPIMAMTVGMAAGSVLAGGLRSRLSNAMATASRRPLISQI